MRGCFLDDLRAFGINADQWTPAAQGEREWRRTAEQGAERFMVKWIAAEKARAGLRHAGQQIVVCANVTGRTNGRMAQRKRVRAWFARHNCLATTDANLYPPGECRIILLWYHVCFVSLPLTVVCVLFRFCFFLFLLIWRRFFFRVFSLGMYGEYSTSYVFSFGWYISTL